MSSKESDFLLSVDRTTLVEEDELVERVKEEEEEYPDDVSDDGVAFAWVVN